MMKVLRIIKSVRRMLFLSKLRVVLSLAGIAVGITSVIIIVSLGDGSQEKMLSQIEAMGSNVITVNAGTVKEVVGRRRQSNTVTTLKEKDAIAIAEECAKVSSVSPTQERTLVVKYENGSTIARIIGTYPSFSSIRNFPLATGRFYSDTDNKLSLRVAVIGQKFVEHLFRNINPIGQVIKINTIPFEVIGVLKAKGSSYDGANEDDIIFIPFNTGLRRVMNVDYIKNIYVKAGSKEKIPTIEKEIRAVLRERHRLQIDNKEDDFKIQNVYTAVQVENEARESFTQLIVSVAALSLLVGGVGILATMLLSINDRKPEIGLRMAVGAKTNDILFQFLLEAIILCVAGGFVGILTGTAGAYLLGLLTDVAIRLSFEATAISFAISMGIGILFGAYPAKKASFIEPVNALKV